MATNPPSGIDFVLAAPNDIPRRWIDCIDQAERLIDGIACSVIVGPAQIFLARLRDGRRPLDRLRAPIDSVHVHQPGFRAVRWPIPLHGRDRTQPYAAPSGHRACRVLITRHQRRSDFQFARGPVNDVNYAVLACGHRQLAAVGRVNDGGDGRVPIPIVWRNQLMPPF